MQIFSRNAELITEVAGKTELTPFREYQLMIEAGGGQCPAADTKETKEEKKRAERVKCWAPMEPLMRRVPIGYVQTKAGPWRRVRVPLNAEMLARGQRKAA